MGEDDDPVAGTVVAVTGASGGIGESIALLLARRGAAVVVGARRADRLTDLVDTIEAAGGRAAALEIDVTRRADLVALVDLARERYGRLDVLVSNAGVGAVGPLDDLAVDDWDRAVDVNLRGVLYGIAAALPVFRAQGSGHFVQILSTSGLRIVPGQAVYAATKNAARTLAEGLRQEAGPTLRVTSVSPGMVDTDFAATGTRDPETRAAMVRRAREIAIGPDAIARAVAYAIEQPPEVDVGDIVVRPTAQS